MKKPAPSGRRFFCSRLFQVVQRLQGLQGVGVVLVLLAQAGELLIMA
mgnify:FL=1